MGVRVLYKRALSAILPPVFIAAVLFSCASTMVPKELPLPAEMPEPVALPKPAPDSGIAGTIRSDTETGLPSALLEALEIIRDRNLGGTEFGRVMTAVNVTLLNTIYPAIPPEGFQPDPPVTHIYSRILREAAKGVYTAPRANSQDYLEHVLPFLAYYPVPGGRVFPPERYLSALADLRKAAELNRESVLAPYFLGTAYERAGRLEEAAERYLFVWESFPECFPAALGLARIMEARGEDSIRFLSELDAMFPGNAQIKRQQAVAYYHLGDWQRAASFAAEVLAPRGSGRARADTRDAEIVLIRAHSLVEQGEPLQAQPLLNSYAEISASGKLYLFLRARVEAEGYRNKDAALSYLRSLLGSAATAIPAPEASASQTANTDAGIEYDAALYAVKLFMESPLAPEQEEGRELLNRLLAAPLPSFEVMSFALNDAVRRGAWLEAEPYLARLLEERRSPQDLLAAYMIAKERGNRAAALAYSRELYQRDRANDEGAAAYVSALVDSGRIFDAVPIIESRLNGLSGGALKSRFYYLRSLTRGSEEASLSDLNASLFEDPRNLDAITALFEIYRLRGDRRRAAYYLRQALFLDPGNPRLTRYEAEYRGA